MGIKLMHAMNRIILFMFGLFGLYHANTPANIIGENTVSVHPQWQVSKAGGDVVIDCLTRDNGKVFWKRAEGLPLPKQAFVIRRRLHIYSIKQSDGGQFVCFNRDKTHKAAAFVKVIGTSTVGYTENTIQTVRPETSRLPIATSPVSFVTYVTDTPYPCTYGMCNGTCCKEGIASSYFDCSNGQKINKSLVCNKENDCADGSDESKCAPWPPKITVLPKHKVEILCGDQEKEKLGTLILECQSVGHPAPIIMWKKYDGHVPSKCQQYSKRGHGILTCPDFQQSDQGAYSCMARNSVKWVESQPKSTVKCINTINCGGFRVVNEEGIEHCLECYCSGKTSQCQSIKSNSTVNKFPFPTTKTEIFAAEAGEIVFIPIKSEVTPTDQTRKPGQEITYCTLTESDFEGASFLKSFGRNIIIPRLSEKAHFSTKAPDLIIRGNGLSLMYKANLIYSPKDSLDYISVRFWPGNWHRLDKKPASRADLMKVLANVDTLFVRCEYQQGKSVIANNATISLESSVITASAAGASYVEKCLCPTGYDGLSCESCATGYKKKSQGDDFICEEVYVPPPCKEGYTGAECKLCDSVKGYVKKGDSCIKPICHTGGSESVLTGNPEKCTCKVGVTGEFCDKCTEGYFFLSSAGCRKCWCSGLTNQCQSSNLRKSVISNTPHGGYNSSDGRNFWLLPSDFSGNRLTSYGGYLNYTMKYKPNIPKENTFLTVEFLSVDDIILTYTHSQIDKSVSRNEKSYSVPIFETNWKKSDKSSVSRGEFLNVLHKIKAIYIESPYHLSSGLANLTSTLMSSTSSNENEEAELAVAVEHCTCPRGYTGLSCEICSDGYYKKRSGIYSRCIKCNCSNCDPEFGCLDCPELTYRDNPEDEKMAVCKPCPCNGNGISCVKDDLNQIFCRCKSGFRGMHCENVIPKETDEFAVTISPRRIRGKKVGTTVFLNCSFSSNEEMVLQAKTTYSAQSKSSLGGSFNQSGTMTNQGLKKTRSFEVVLKNGLEAIECLVYDAQGKLAGHVMAIVEDLITVTKPVKITNCYSDRIYVKESEDKELICEAQGSPTPMLNWYRLKKGISPTKVDTSDGVHTIESVSLNDNGTIYTCIAENSDGDKATCTQVLIVQKKCEVIKIMPKAVRTEESKNVSVLCKTTAKSAVTWSLRDSSLGKQTANFSDRVKINGGYLQIFNAKVSDSGTYICSANGENGVINKTISVEVTEKKMPPTAVIHEYDKVLKVGESFEVTCIGSGKPTPQITWKKLNGSLDRNVIANGSRLSIYNAVSKNSGVYECEAQSALGKDSSYISIEVEEIKYPPRVNISEENIYVHVEEDVTLACLAVGYPRPRLTWFAPNVTFTQISSANDSMVLMEPQESTKEEITFKVTKEMDGSTVYCTAESTAGRAEKAAVVKVLQSKNAVNETIEFVPIGSYFELICEFTGNLTWRKHGGLVGNECPIPSGYMIPSVQIQNNGTYICEAGSDSKKIMTLIVVGFVPKFSSNMKSYLVLPVMSESNHELRVEMSFYSTSENGLILMKDDDRFAIYLENSKIHLSVHSNIIKTHTSIQLEKWFSLVVTVNGHGSYVDVTIYDEKSSIHERKTVDSDYFKFIKGHVSDSFFVGGYVKHRHPLRLFTRRIPHFDGCVSRLKINRHEYDIVKEGSYSENVTLCRRCSEEENLCYKRGKCLDAPTQYGFICVCPPNLEKTEGTTLKRYKDKTCPQGCAGKGCETQLDLCALLRPCSNFHFHKCINNMYRLECNCAYGYTGTTCEKVQEYSFCAKGNGFVRLPSNLLERHLGEPEKIKMAFTLHQTTGQLFWQGDRYNHLSIAVTHGILRYIYMNQNSQLVVHSVDRLEMNEKHTLSIIRIKDTVTLELSGPKIGTKIYRNSTGKFRTNRVAGYIYLGNVPNHTFPFEHRIGLNGCIHYVSFGDMSKINLPEKELEKFNVYQPLNAYFGSSETDELEYNDVESDYT